MGKDLIIGGASNYGWNELKYWVNSIQRSGFQGDIVVVATSITRETIEKLIEKNVKVAAYGKQDDKGNFVAQSNVPPHVERFFYMWDFLRKNVDEYDYVITTDTRDVVFQSNPTAWIDEAIFEGYEAIIASSEGLAYEDEPWSNRNLLEAFGPYFHNVYKSSTIYNVGTIAGELNSVKDLLFMIFQMSINRPIPIVDQAVYNVLLNQTPYKHCVKFTDNKDAWAIQLGTTIEAVKMGKGDIGLSVAQNPTNMILYQSKYKDEQPKFVDGYVVNNNNQKFIVVHQYDRTVWAKEIMEKYDD
jgi:hypothetical protein